MSAAPGPVGGMLPPLDPAVAAGTSRLRERLLAEGFTPDGVIDLLGARAHAALGRSEMDAAHMRATDAGPLGTLVRLFLLGGTEPADAVTALGLGPPYVQLAGDRARAALDLRPYAEDWIVVSDRAVGPGTVTGVGGASLSLVGATPPPTMPPPTTPPPTTPLPTPLPGRAPILPPAALEGGRGASLDVGTGSGVQALHLAAAGTGPVVATDSEPRALALAELTLGLSGVRGVELRLGSLLDPVAGRRFDRVVSNPPFVAGPGGRERLSYRDSGLDGDELCARLVRGCADVLTDGGTATVLANWLHVAGIDWRERVAGWLPPGVDARVLQREVQDPAEYVGIWSRDAGRADERAANEQWLRWFDDRGVEAVGFGIIWLRRTGGPPRVVLEDARQPLDGPLGPEQAGWFAAAEALRGDPGALLLRPAAGLQLEHRAVPAMGGWQELSTTVIGPAPLRWRTEVDAVAATLIAGCDGGRTLAQVARDLAPELGTTAGELVGMGAALLARGHLVPADAD